MTFDSILFFWEITNCDIIFQRLSLSVFINKNHIKEHWILFLSNKNYRVYRFLWLVIVMNILIYWQTDCKDRWIVKTPLSTVNHKWVSQLQFTQFTPDLLVIWSIVLQIAVNQVFLEEMIPFQLFQVYMKGKWFRSFQSSISRSKSGFILPDGLIYDLFNQRNKVQTTDNAQNIFFIFHYRWHTEQFFLFTAASKTPTIDWVRPVLN